MGTRPFGTAGNGADAHLYTLENAAGMQVGLTDLGATLVSCRVPDGRGSYPDVTLGYSGAAGYRHNTFLLGAIIGRYANRIAGASFELGGTTYRLAANEGPNSNHSGPKLWCERMWRLYALDDRRASFELTSRKGDQGFPGACQVRVTYRLSEDNCLTITSEAQPSEPTIINMVSHAYWNLNGHAAGSVAGHTLRVDSSAYTPADERNIPTGEIAPVEGTPFDLRTDTTLARPLQALAHGLDTNYTLGNAGRMAHAARLVGDETGITLDISTDAAGLQVYSGGYLDEPCGKDGAHYGPYAGIALEAQHYPDAIHHKQFPQPVYTPQRPFCRKVAYAFGFCA